MKEVHVSIWGNGQLVADQVTFSTLQSDLPPNTPAIPGAPVGHRMTFVLPPEVIYSWGAWLTIECPGYAPYRERVIIAPDIDVALVPAAVLPRLQPSGQCFIRADGVRFTAIECSDFLLYQRYLNGENIEPVLTQRRDLGFNMVRVFGCYNNAAGLGRFIPAEYGEAYYTQLPDFYRLLARFQLYGEFVANADSRTVFASATPQTAHWMRLGTIFPGIPNALVECVNENDQPINTLWADLVPMRDVLSAHGSNGSQAWPVMPHWAWASMHYNSAPEWWRKPGHNSMEVWAGPTLANENTRYPDRDQSLAHAEDAAKGAALLCAGSCYHSVHGKTSELFQPGVELDAAAAWVRGAQSVDLAFQPGTYLHRTDLEPPGILRAYERRLPNGQGFVVQIRV